MPKITMLSALFAVAASVKLLLNGNLISLTFNLVDPLCERGTIVGREAKVGRNTLSATREPPEHTREH